MKRKKHLGSKLDDFLDQEGILEESTEIATKRVFVFQLQSEMEKQNIDKSELAQRLSTSRSAVDRILDPKAPSTLRTFAKTARALGKHLEISLV